MNRSLFDFNPPAWLPTQDKTVLEYCRNIKREEMEITNENGYSIRVVPHPSSAVTLELFNWIWKSDVEDKKTVIVFPNSWRNIYSTAVQMCNKYNVSGRNIHAFCMDEWADEHGNVAPVTYGPSLAATSCGSSICSSVRICVPDWIRCTTTPMRTSATTPS